MNNSLFLQIEVTDFASRLREWRSKGIPELGDVAGMGIGRTTSAVLGHPEFLTDPHKVMLCSMDFFMVRVRRALGKLYGGSVGTFTMSEFLEKCQTLYHGLKNCTTS